MTGIIPVILLITLNVFIIFGSPSTITGQETSEERMSTDHVGIFIYFATKSLSLIASVLFSDV